MTLLEINADQETTSIVEFLKRTFEQAGKTHAVIALSGGIDSTLSFLLTVRALGKDNVFPIHLPSKTSNREHSKDVHTLLTSVEFPTDQLTTIPIGSMIQKTWRTIGNNTPTPKAPEHTANRRSKNAHHTELNHMRLANITARLRMIAIFDHAKRHDALVIGTENYSEHLLGYFTRFGDEASDIEPIRHLYKTQVVALAKYLNAPPSIITKAPSADLWVGQSDENEMGFSYAQADPILYLHDQGKNIKEIIAEGHNEAIVEKVLALVAKNHFKQEVPYKL
jgi:NAD+ synthase